MKYVLLCGGNGLRLYNSNGFPKPLNHVLGVHSIQYVLESIPSDEIYIILNKDLKEYNFETLTHHLVKKKYIHVYIDRYTRGPVETAYLGLQKLNFSSDEQVCFFDNDTIYNLRGIEIPSDTFIGYSTIINISEQRPYCYIEMSNNKLTNITEKIKISNHYANGIYSFKSVKEFLDISKKLLLSNYTFNNEFYMSLLYDMLLKSNYSIKTVYVPNVICLGTHRDIVSRIHDIPIKKLRICFDIDNTLFKYKQPGQTYRDCDVIEKNVFLLKKLKEAGHTIILHTARGMKTANDNLGLAMKTVANDTFSSLEKNNIPFDEIYFGKPNADLYIDDKAFNPYMNLFDSIGFSHYVDEYENSHNFDSSSNKFNTIYKKGKTIVKIGPCESMQGEIYFYKTISATSISNLFPKFHSSDTLNNRSQIVLDYIQGFTFYDLLKDELLTTNHLMLLLDSLHRLHTYSGIPVHVSKESVYQNYIGKLRKRIANIEDYPFKNALMIADILDRHIKEYIYDQAMSCVSVVHGDPWFSNTLLTTSNNIIFLDMKGDISGTLTTNGDSLTDYGKIFQSILGFDLILNNQPINTEYMNELKNIFISYMLKRGYTHKQLYAITSCLIAKTLSFLHVSLEVRIQIWKLVENLCELL